MAQHPQALGLRRPLLAVAVRLAGSVLLQVALAHEEEGELALLRLDEDVVPEELLQRLPGPAANHALLVQTLQAVAHHFGDVLGAVAADQQVVDLGEGVLQPALMGVDQAQVVGEGGVVSLAADQPPLGSEQAT